MTTTPTPLYLKALGPKRRAVYGQGTWPYRRWTEPTPPVPCRSGWHVCTPEQMLRWLPSHDGSLWVVEIKGETVTCEDKIVAEQARLVRKLRWNKDIALALAIDAAEIVLPLFEEQHPDDDRPRRAIAAARSGDARAARAAADDASDAARAVHAAARAAAYAASDAARAAARAAAYAASDAAWATAVGAVAAGGAAGAAADAAYAAVNATAYAAAGDDYSTQLTTVLFQHVGC